MKRKALLAAFPHTIPVFTGYLVLGISYGVLITAKGFPFWMPMLTSLSIFAGSMEFVLVNLLLSGFDLLQAFLMTLMINARHLFYGLSMLDRYKGMGLKKLYLIYGLTDETFSIVCGMEPPEGVDRGSFSLFVTLLDHSYWVLGCTLGGIFGSMLSFNTRGAGIRDDSHVRGHLPGKLAKGKAASSCDRWCGAADRLLADLWSRELYDPVHAGDPGCADDLT